jgi:hypothetical protein
VQTKEDSKPMMLMARVAILLNALSSLGYAINLSLFERLPLCVIKGKVFAQLDGEAKHDDASSTLIAGQSTTCQPIGTPSSILTR